SRASAALGGSLSLAPPDGARGVPRLIRVAHSLQRVAVSLAEALSVSKAYLPYSLIRVVSTSSARSFGSGAASPTGSTRATAPVSVFPFLFQSMFCGEPDRGWSQFRGTAARAHPEAPAHRTGVVCPKHAALPAFAGPAGDAWAHGRESRRPSGTRWAPRVSAAVEPSRLPRGAIGHLRLHPHARVSASIQTGVETKLGLGSILP